MRKKLAKYDKVCEQLCDTYVVGGKFFITCSYEAAVCILKRWLQFNNVTMVRNINRLSPSIDNYSVFNKGAELFIIPSKKIPDIR